MNSEQNIKNVIQKKEESNMKFSCFMGNKQI